MTDKRLVLTTCGSLEEARGIAHALVERQLAACVNIVPQIESVYRWQGEIETATEWLLVIKTTADGFRSRARCSKRVALLRTPRMHRDCD
jgi:periplasmic divalent cation tolerance protein